jgi:hypothetical protein
LDGTQKKMTSAAAPHSTFHQYGSGKYKGKEGSAPMDQKLGKRIGCAALAAQMLMSPAARAAIPLNEVMPPSQVTAVAGQADSVDTDSPPGGDLAVTGESPSVSPTPEVRQTTAADDTSPSEESPPDPTESPPDPAESPPVEETAPDPSEETDPDPSTESATDLTTDDAQAESSTTVTTKPNRAARLLAPASAEAETVDEWPVVNYVAVIYGMGKYGSPTTDAREGDYMMEGKDWLERQGSPKAYEYYAASYTPSDYAIDEQPEWTPDDNFSYDWTNGLTYFTALPTKDQLPRIPNKEFTGEWYIYYGTNVANVVKDTKESYTTGVDFLEDSYSIQNGKDNQIRRFQDVYDEKRDNVQFDPNIPLDEYSKYVINEDNFILPIIGKWVDSSNATATALSLQYTKPKNSSTETTLTTEETSSSATESATDQTTNDDNTVTVPLYPLTSSKDEKEA